MTDPTIRAMIRVRQEGDSKRRYEDRSRGLRVRERFEDRGSSHKTKNAGGHYKSEKAKKTDCPLEPPERT